MNALSLSRRAYDHRIRNAICETGNPRLFPQLRIPRSTTATWLSRGCRKVTSVETDNNVLKLLNQIDNLKRSNNRLAAILRLLVALRRASGFKLDEQRLADGAAKTKILRAVDRCKDALPRKAALRIMRLSPARYYAWRQAERKCELDDRSSCPRSHPTQLTPNEVSTIRDMVIDVEYRHMPLRTLALHAQRVGKVFASATTWAKLVRQHGWRRPRRRVYPEKPKVGIRATRSNELWHVDVTIIKLLDGTKSYLHAVIDNFSRRILSWRLAQRLSPTTTCEILREAGNNLGTTPTVVVDSGVENVNGEVDQLVTDGLLERLLAQVDVSFSNSMIEAFWRSLRHQWLYLHSLDSLATLERLVGFYVTEHNAVMPHSAFHGQTPDEIYFERCSQVGDDLAAARLRARHVRMETNRRASCRVCDPSVYKSTSDSRGVAIANMS